MNPSEVPARDWSLYYNNSYMLHDKLGVVNVSVESRRLMVRKSRGGEWIQADPNKLACIWPRPRAINFNDCGIYVGRRSRREARRSATAGHYYIKWSHDGFMMDSQVMQNLCFPAEYPSLGFATRALDQRERTSVAITEDLILSRGNTEEQYELIVVGRSAGFFNNIDGRLRPVDSDEVRPETRRAIAKLEKEGFLWQI